MMNSITLICGECNGYGESSSCCNDYINNNKCNCCGKFCRSEICYECDGEGEIIYSIGDHVEINVNIYSLNSLKKELSYYPKNLQDSKTFNGNIIQIVDKNYCKVKIKYSKKEIKIQYNELILI